MIEDGATRWVRGEPRPPAKGFDMEARYKLIYEWMRQIRGGVVGGAFSVERQISAAILFFMLGERAKREEILRTFDEGFLRPLTFERRINVALLIAPIFMTKADASSLRRDLNELRVIRNAMAHEPFWFHPEINDGGEVFNLVPMMQIGKTITPITTSFVSELNEKIANLIERTAKLAADVRMHELK